MISNKVNRSVATSNSYIYTATGNPDLPLVNSDTTQQKRGPGSLLASGTASAGNDLDGLRATPKLRVCLDTKFECIQTHGLDFLVGPDPNRELQCQPEDRTGDRDEQTDADYADELHDEITAAEYANC